MNDRDQFCGIPNGVIYVPAGKAFEFSHGPALNCFTGCTHSCSYCYVPDVMHKPVTVFHQSSKPRDGILRKLERQLGRSDWFVGKNVFMSFTCDPCGPANNGTFITEQAIDLIHNAGATVTVLTKGGFRSGGAIDHMRRGVGDEGDAYAVTLTGLSDEWCIKHEPGAGLASERVAMLQKAFGQGIRTWVSLEPILSEENTYEIIRATRDFVYEYKLGPDNYDKAVRDAIDWPSTVAGARDLATAGGCTIILKDALKALL